MSFPRWVYFFLGVCSFCGSFLCYFSYLSIDEVYSRSYVPKMFWFFNTIQENVEERVDAEKIVLATVVCKKPGKTVGQFQDYIRLTQTMLQSALWVTRMDLHIVLVSNHQGVAELVVSPLKNWATKYKPNTMFTVKNTSYPQEHEHLVSLFRLCSTQRLYLPTLLPNIDSIIYADTDFVFLRPLEQLWKAFKTFNATQLAAMPECPGCIYTNDEYNKTKRWPVPFYGKYGLNAGLVLLNLTRIRSSLSLWHQEILNTSIQYKQFITYGDQDILNNIFYRYPRWLHPLGCEWNFCPLYCMDRKMCPRFESHGFPSIHFLASSWRQGDFSRLHKAIGKIDPHRNVSREAMTKNLTDIFKIKFSSCEANIKGVVDGMRQELMNSLNT